MTPRQVISGNTQNLACKRMLGYFPKIPPHKRMSESPDWKRG